MIIKVIAVFPCGNKVINENKNGLPSYMEEITLGDSRPNLIQIFTTGCDEKCKQEVFEGFKPVLHTVHGQITIDGEHLTP